MSKTSIPGVVLAAVALLAPAGAYAQSDSSRVLHLTFDPGGVVTLTAQNVSVPDILAEWARLCGCVVMNGDKAPGGPLAVPVQFERAPQDQVLKSLLRQAGGYILTKAAAGSTGPSLYATIYILAPGHAAPVNSFASPFIPVQTPIIPSPGAPDDEIPPVTPIFGLQPRQGEQPPPPPQPAQPPPGSPYVPGPSVPVFVPIVPVGPSGQPTQTPPPAEQPLPPPPGGE